MKTVQVTIRTSTLAGKRLLKEIEKQPDAVKIEKHTPKNITGQKTYTLDESYEECCEILSKNYGVDVRKL